MATRWRRMARSREQLLAQSAEQAAKVVSAQADYAHVAKLLADQNVEFGRTRQNLDRASEMVRFHENYAKSVDAEIIALRYEVAELKRKLATAAAARLDELKNHRDLALENKLLTRQVKKLNRKHRVVRLLTQIAPAQRAASIGTPIHLL